MRDAAALLCSALLCSALHCTYHPFQHGIKTNHAVSQVNRRRSGHRD